MNRCLFRLALALAATAFFIQKTAAQDWIARFHEFGFRDNLNGFAQNKEGNYIGLDFSQSYFAPYPSFTSLVKIDRAGQLAAWDSTGFSNLFANRLRLERAPDGRVLLLGAWGGNEGLAFEIHDDLTRTWLGHAKIDSLINGGKPSVIPMANALGGIDLISIGLQYSATHFLDSLRVWRFDSTFSKPVWRAAYEIPPSTTSWNVGYTDYEATPDGGLLIYHFYGDYGAFRRRIWRIAPDGALKWANQSDSPANSLSDYHNVTWAGGACYASYSNGVYKFNDATGQPLWSKSLPSGLREIRGARDGGFFAVRFVELANNGGRLFVEKYSNAGSLLVQRSLILDDPANGGIAFEYSYPPFENDSADLIVTGAFSRFGTNPDEGTAYAMQFGREAYYFPFRAEGMARIDADGGCLPDSTEAGAANLFVKIADATDEYVYSTDENGHYSAPCKKPTAALTIEPGAASPYFEACLDSVALNFSAQNVQTVDWAIRKTADCPLLQIDAATPFLRRCFPNDYLIRYENRGTQPAQNAFADVKLDSKMTFLSAERPSVLLAPGSLRFELGDVAAGAGGQFWIHFDLSCDAELGEELCVTAVIWPDTVCSDDPKWQADPPASARDCRIVQGSFDPNEKLGLPESPTGKWSVQPDSSIAYMIRFQNTGTDTAFKIVVIDTLAAALDPETFEFLSASHQPVRWSMHRSELRFEFDPIRLPDSAANEAASHGFVKFRVRPRRGLPLGTAISNRAAIYFDRNAPIITNAVEHKIETSVRASEADAARGAATISPNPTTGRFALIFENEWRERRANLFIFNELGETVFSKTIRDNEKSTLEIDLGGQPDGLYFLKIEAADASSVFKKLVIARR